MDGNNVHRLFPNGVSIGKPFPGTKEWTNGKLRQFFKLGLVPESYIEVTIRNIPENDKEDFIYHLMGNFVKLLIMSKNAYCKNMDKSSDPFFEETCFKQFTFDMIEAFFKRMGLDDQTTNCFIGELSAQQLSVFGKQLVNTILEWLEARVQLVCIDIPD